MPAWIRTIPALLAITFAQAAPAHAQAWIKSMAPGATQAFESVDLDTRLLRFWDTTGAPIAVIQYALTLHDVITGAGPEVTVAMGLRLTGEGPQAKDSSWTQATGPIPDHAGDRFATGVAVLPLGPETTTWFLTLGRPGSVERRNGAVATQQPLPSGSIVVSDLALAGDEAADSWQFGEQSIRIGRTGAFDRKVPVHITYLVKSDSNRDEARTWVTVTNVTDQHAGTRVLQLNFLGRLNAGINYVERELDMSKRKAGVYQVELQVGGVHGGGASVRLATFTLR